MRTAAIALVATLTGAGLGVFATHHAWLVYAELRRENMRLEFGLEQRYLASRAMRRDDRLGAIVHSVNAADTYAEVGFQWLRRQRAMDHSLSIVDVLESYPTARSALADTGTFEPETVLESSFRAAAAARIERTGLAELAEREWKRAFAVSDYSETQVRATGEALAPPIDHHPMFEAGETAYLESSTPEELHEALAALRAEHCPACDE